MSPSPCTIGVWIPVDPDRPLAPPHTRPMGRAALALRDEGLEIVFGDRWEGDRLVGMVATSKGWEPARRRVRAVQDRYPGQSRRTHWDTLHATAAAAAIPVGNSRALTLLCRDKLACQQALAQAPALRLPPVEARPASFAAAQARWGGAFAKPRFGALGIGVHAVGPSEPVPAELPGVVDGTVDPTLVQWPVPPPSGRAGAVLRVLAQRTVRPSGLAGWHLLPPVLRESATDRVVNAARGARVLPAEDALGSVVVDEVYQAVHQVCKTLAATPGALALELGVDLALDADLRPWVLEVNSRPRGRLGVLARLDPDRFGAEHTAAMHRPWRTLAQLAEGA